jgi:hypothetical protein
MSVFALKIPPSSPVLPENCIIISFDCEANRSPPDKSFVPGSTLSLGAVAFLWPEGTLVPRSIKDAFFYRQIIPTVSIDTNTAEFWDNHPEAKLVAYGNIEHRYYTPQNIKEINSHVVEDWLTWLHYLQQDYNRPLALLAHPLDYDAAHVCYLITTYGQEDPLLWEGITWHDVAEVLPTYMGLSKNICKSQFKQYLAEVPHIACQDALLQGQAFFRCLGKRRTPMAK